MTKDRSQWSEVWMRFRSGDRYAFSEIYEEFIDVLFAYGSKITHDRELLKDCIQDVFFNLQKYNPKLRHPEYLEFYLFRALKNAILARIKKNKIETSLTNDGVLQFDLKFHEESEELDVESLEFRRKALGQVLNTLDSQKREILFLKFSTGLSYIEIGQLLSISPDSVKKQVYRTLGQLRNRFGEKLLELLCIWVKK